MTDDLEAAARSLRAALDKQTDPVDVTMSLPRSSAQQLLTLLDAENAVVVPVRDLYTTTEAASMLGISRPTLMKLLESGELESEKVGTHHRIPATAIAFYERTRQANRDRAAQAMSEFAERVGRDYQSNVTFDE